MDYYKIDHDKITIFPFPKQRWLSGLKWCFVGYLIIIFFIFAMGKIKAETFWIINGFLSFFPLLFMIAFVMNHYRIIFDNFTRTVYRKTLWGTQALLPFEQIGQIKLETFYRVFNKKNPFGRGYIISPDFESRFKEKKEDFEAKVLPAINAMLYPYIKDSPVLHNELLNKDGNFVFYRRHPMGYALVRKKSLQLIFIGLIFLLTACGYDTFFPWQKSNLIPFLVLLISTCILLVKVSRRIIIDTREQSIKVLYFGRLFEVFQMADFVGCEVIKSYINDMYHGTKLKFNFKSGDLTLIKFLSTTKISELVQETKSILSEGRYW